MSVYKNQCVRIDFWNGWLLDLVLLLCGMNVCGVSTHVGSCRVFDDNTPCQ